VEFEGGWHTTVLCCALLELELLKCCIHALSFQDVLITWYLLITFQGDYLLSFDIPPLKPLLNMQHDSGAQTMTLAVVMTYLASQGAFQTALRVSIARHSVA
jgi:hypothetical protein